MTDLPPPVQLSEREAIATLRVIAAMQGGSVIRIYGDYKSPPVRLRKPNGYAILADLRLIRDHPNPDWRLQPTWIFSASQSLLMWGAPNVLKGYAGGVTWRFLDEAL